MTDECNGRERYFGVLLDAIVNPYQRNIVDALTRAVEQTPARLIFFLGGRIHSGQENEDRMKFVYQLISRESVDGLILVSNCLICDKSAKAAYLRMFSSIPTVNIGTEIDGANNFLIDNSSGIRRIVRHMAETHRAKDFAYVGGIKDNPDAEERYRAFRQALAELDIPFDPDLLYTGNFEQDSGTEAAKYLLARGKAIDTIVVANDTMAIGVMDELHKTGRKIPRDIRITGFDDIPDSSFCIPSLTTAGQPFDRIARTAIESLFQIMAGKEIPDRVVVPVDLIVRQSCGCSPRVAVDWELPARRPEEGDDGRLLPEKILRDLSPAFDPILTAEVKESVRELVRSLVLPAQDGRHFITRWDALMDEMLVRSEPPEFLERLLIGMGRYAAAGTETDRTPPGKTNLLIQSAWFLLYKKLTLWEKSRQYKLDRDDVLLQYFRVLTTMEAHEENMTHPIRYFVPRLGIANFFVVKFENGTADGHSSARMVMHQCTDPDAVISKDPFPSRRLLPGGMRTLAIRSNWVVEAVSLYDEIGFIVLEMSSRNLLVYSQIRTIVSSDMQENLLFGRLQEQTENLQTQSAELTRSVEYLRKIMGAVIQTLSMMVEAKDPYTAGHERRVSDLARTIAAAMDLPFETTEAVRLASVIHDIGKLYIPSEILNKPGKLLEAEFALIKLHPKIAFDILKNIDFPWPLADIVYQHHERRDGSGYPRGLSGGEILVESRIIAVADVVEAMASHRPYRPSRGIDAALREISDNRGSKYDPDVVDICLKLFAEKGYTLKE